MRRGPVFREALDVAVPERWSEYAFEYRLGYDAGRRFKKYFPSPSIHEDARNAFRAGWSDARRKVITGAPPTPLPSPASPTDRHEGST